MTEILVIGGLKRSFYGVQALRGVDSTVHAGTITALIGPNRAGKTTAFQCISGVVPPDGGRVTFGGQDITGWRPDRVTSPTICAATASPSWWLSTTWI